MRTGCRINTRDRSHAAMRGGKGKKKWPKRPEKSIVGK